MSTQDADTPRLEPVPEQAGLPEHGMPSPEEAANGLLPDAGRDDVLDVGRVTADLGIDLPEDPSEAAAMLLRAVLDSRREAGDYLQTMQRVAADFENYRKRVERDRVENITRSAQRVLERLLPALDSFDAALAYDPQSPAEDKILAGMRGTHAQLLDILAAEGLEPISAVGEVFDPSVHEAAAGPQADGEGSLVVAQELRSGYLMRGRVLRPSLVVVERG